MLRRCLLLICVLSLAFAKTPRPFPNIPIQTTDRKGIDVKKYRGKIVLLVLFATSCDECVGVVSLMSKLEKDYAARGFQAIGAAVDDNAAYTVTPFIQRYRPPFPIGFLDKDALIKIADIPPGQRPFVPILMFINQTGNVRFQYYGNDPFLKDVEKGTRAIVTGLMNARDTGQEPQKVVAPAPPK
jgi:peroxiredoxin